MAKSSPEKLAQALRANLKRRKGTDGAKHPVPPPAGTADALNPPPQAPGPEQV